MTLSIIPNPYPLSLAIILGWAVTGQAVSGRPVDCAAWGGRFGGNLGSGAARPLLARPRA